MQDLRNAVRDKKTPFWKIVNEVVPWAMLEERRVDINTYLSRPPQRRIKQSSSLVPISY